MKFIITPFKSLICLFALIIFASCSSDDDQIIDTDDNISQEEIVEVPDLLLKAAVKSQLNLDADEDITTENMLELEELDISGLPFAELSDLTGLQYATNLTYLRFGDTSVTNLDPISNLENIEYLRFNNTGITNISALSKYTSLTYFNANTVKGLSNISPLAGNTGLKEIILRDVPFGNDGMETIKNFTALYRINMRGTGVTDLSILGDLMAEGALLDSTPGAAEAGGADVDLRGLLISNFTPIIPYLGSITNIEGIPANEPVDVPDERLANQIRLALGINNDVVLGTLYMLSLTELNLDGAEDMSANGDIREIADLTGLEFAENITYLRFGATAVIDLSPISKLQKVEYLRFNNTGITDISPLSGYISLTYFNANSVRGITDISALAGNTGIKEIILREVPFGNNGMATIANFTSMYRINMRSTEVTDITVLGELMVKGALLDSTPDAEENGWATLDLRGLEVDDWSPIEPYVDQISNLEGGPF